MTGFLTFLTFSSPFLTFLLTLKTAQILTSSPHPPGRGEGEEGEGTAGHGEGVASSLASPLIVVAP